jgi:hypothetical protein
LNVRTQYGVHDANEHITGTLAVTP